MDRNELKRLAERDRNTLAPLEFLAEALPELARRGGRAANASPLAAGVVVTQAAVMAVSNAHAEHQLTKRYAMHCDTAEYRAQALEREALADADERERLLARLAGDPEAYLQGVQAVMAAGRARTRGMVEAAEEDGIW